MTKIRHTNNSLEITEELVTDISWITSVPNIKSVTFGNCIFKDEILLPKIESYIFANCVIANQAIKVTCDRALLMNCIGHISIAANDISVNDSHLRLTAVADSACFYISVIHLSNTNIKNISNMYSCLITARHPTVICNKQFDFVTSINIPHTAIQLLTDYKSIVFGSRAVSITELADVSKWWDENSEDPEIRAIDDAYHWIINNLDELVKLGKQDYI